MTTQNATPEVSTALAEEATVAITDSTTSAPTTEIPTLVVAAIEAAAPVILSIGANDAPAQEAAPVDTNTGFPAITVGEEVSVSANQVLESLGKTLQVIAIKATAMASGALPALAAKADVPLYTLAPGEKLVRDTFTDEERSELEARWNAVHSKDRRRS